MIVVCIVCWLFGAAVIAWDIYAHNWIATCVAAVCLIVISVMVKVSIDLRRP